MALNPLGDQARLHSAVRKTASKETGSAVFVGSPELLTPAMGIVKLPSPDQGMPTEGRGSWQQEKDYNPLARLWLIKLAFMQKANNCMS